MCADEPCSLGSEGMNVATFVHAADAPTGVQNFTGGHNTRSSNKSANVHCSARIRFVALRLRDVNATARSWAVLAIHEGESQRLRRKRFDAHARTSVPANRHRRRRANSYARRFIMFAKGSMVRVLRHRRSPLDCRRRVEPARKAARTRKRHSSGRRRRASA
jgi:hypothetical protein